MHLTWSAFVIENCFPELYIAMIVYISNDKFPFHYNWRFCSWIIGKICHYHFLACWFTLHLYELLVQKSFMVKNMMQYFLKKLFFFLESKKSSFVTERYEGSPFHVIFISCFFSYHVEKDSRISMWIKWFSFKLRYIGLLAVIL